MCIVVVVEQIHPVVKELSATVWMDRALGVVLSEGQRCRKVEVAVVADVVHARIVLVLLQRPVRPEPAIAALAVCHDVV